MREAGLERQIVSYATDKGWKQRKVEYSGRRGAADRWFFNSGHRLVILEVKRSEEAPISPHQKREIEWLRGFGFNAHIVHSFDEAKRLLDDCPSMFPIPATPVDILLLLTNLSEGVFNDNGDISVTPPEDVTELQIQAHFLRKKYAPSP